MNATNLLRKWTLPRDYMGAEWNGYFVFLGQHRDSDSVTRSNFRVALAGLNALPAWPGCDDDDAVSRYIVRENHWAVGWVEWIAIHESDAAAVEAAEGMLARIENYPLLDEDDHSELEYTEASDQWARASVKGRLDILKWSKAAVSMFAARREELPSDDDGRLWEYLTTD